MKIVLSTVGKRFNHTWIFKNIDFEFETGKPYVILGPNGSGKSTLIQLIAGFMLPTEGTVKYFSGNKAIESENIFKSISIAAPYMQLIEELTVEEFINFYFQFKSFTPGYNTSQIIEMGSFKKDQNKQLKYFSSGMKQRLRLALAILSDTPILLLDEPLSNIDNLGTLWYKELMNQFSPNRIVVICSNQQGDEYEFCKAQINIEDFK